MVIFIHNAKHTNIFLKMKLEKKVKKVNIRNFFPFDTHVCLKTCQTMKTSFNLLFKNIKNASGLK